MPSVTRRATTRRQPKRASVEDQLLAAVERRVGAGHSFTSLSIDQLAKEAGVSRATFYLHFNGKGDLVARLLARIKEEILASIGIWYQEAAGVNRVQVRDATAGLLTVLKRHNAILTAVSETSAYDPAVKKLQDQIANEIVMRSLKTMKEVKTAGRAHADVSPQVVEVLTWFVYHAGLQFSRRASDAKIKQLAETFGHIFRAALFVSEPPRGK